MRDFQRTDDRVDAIVLDAVTPRDNGASLARHAKNLRLPVVMISGSHDIMGFAAEDGLQPLHKLSRVEELYAALHKARSSGGVRPAASVLTQPLTTLSAAVGQKGGRASSSTVRT
jgi:DNA-binding response OmpR family regulator